MAREDRRGRDDDRQSYDREDPDAGRDALPARGARSDARGPASGARQADGADEEETLETRSARAARNSPGRETPGRTAPPAEGVLVQICERCGKQYHFDQHDPPASLTCEKCGNQVFRSFFDVTRYDEVDADFRESTERDTDTNDDESDVTRADILDLNNP